MTSRSPVAGVLLVFHACALVCGAASAAEAHTPLVLVPGFLGQRHSGVLQHYFAASIVEALAGAGVDVTELAPAPVADSDARGRDLLRQIDAVRARTGARTVVVISHSQGGVDVRAALAQGGADRIAVVATIAAPHQGTGVADTALTWPMPAVRATLDTLGVTWQLAQGDDATAPDPDGALENLSRRGMARFAATHPPPPAQVPFFSVAGVTGRDVDGSCSGGRWSAPTVTDEMHPLLVFGAAMIRASWGDVSHDGVVPTRSMRYATFLGCVPADHLDWEGFDDTGAFDVAAFVLELYRGLDDVARTGDAAAMDAHIDRLAFLAHARPNEERASAP